MQAKQPGSPTQGESHSQQAFIFFTHDGYNNKGSGLHAITHSAASSHSVARVIYVCTLEMAKKKVLEEEGR